MFRYVFVLAPLLATVPAQAQLSLSDQIAAVRAAQDNEQARQDAVQRAAADQAERAAAQQRAAAIAVEQQKVRLRNKMLDEAAADKKRDQSYEDQLRSLQVDYAKLLLLEEQQKVTTDKQRDQAYEDRLRDVELQTKLIELKRAEVRVARENEVIDRDLRRQDTQTDVVQSDADATRNLSEGAKAFMQNLGTAAAKSQTRPDVSHAATQ